jgi:hypothetical protein
MFSTRPSEVIPGVEQEAMLLPGASGRDQCCEAVLCAQRIEGFPTVEYGRRDARTGPRWWPHCGPVVDQEDVGDVVDEHRDRQRVHRGEGDRLDFGHGSYAAIIPSQARRHRSLGRLRADTLAP